MMRYFCGALAFILFAFAGLLSSAQAANISFDLGTIAPVGTPLVPGGTPSTYSAQLTVYDSGPVPGYYNPSGTPSTNLGYNVVRPDGSVATSFGFIPGSNGATDFEYAFTFTSPVSATFKSFGAPIDGGGSDNITSAGLYEGGSLIAAASLFNGGNGVGYSFGPASLTGGVQYKLDVMGSTGASGFSEINAEIDNVSATPLPPALPMFGAALLALAGFAAWSRRSARG